MSANRDYDNYRKYDVAAYSINGYNDRMVLSSIYVLNDMDVQYGIGDKTGSIKVGRNADFIILDTKFLDYK